MSFVGHHVSHLYGALQEAWEANTMSVQDCIDHEVYKMIGRHGPHVVRGIVPTKKLRDVILVSE